MTPDGGQGGTAGHAHVHAGERRDRTPALLAALVSVFVLSHAFRTVIAIAAEPLATELNASPRDLGTVAGAFHIAFALAQPAVGIALDRYGPRRTVLAAFALSLVGSLVSATATRLDVLIAGQWLIGFGCAPALLAAMVLVSTRYPADRFASLSGAILAIGGIGLMLTGTPLAWLVETWSWRAAFVVLGSMSVAAWLAVLLCSGDERPANDGSIPTIGSALRGLTDVVARPHTLGICCLAAVTYAAFLALRGLWIGPLFTERHAFSLVEVGHVALAMSFAVTLGPFLIGRFDPGGRARRRLIVAFSAAYSIQFALLALGGPAMFDVVLAVFTGLSGGYVVLQYADVRSAYPSEMTGRALSVFTMAMFGGVAAMQWLSGAAATSALAQDIDPSQAALLVVALLIALATVAFWLLPHPPSPARARQA